MADVAVVEIEEGGMKKTAKDLFAGAAGGIAQVLLGK
jgi:solute carrier family 25 carnitine/acylcarnitine transporter 20/29